MIGTLSLSDSKVNKSAWPSGSKQVLESFVMTPDYTARQSYSMDKCHTVHENIQAQSNIPTTTDSRCASTENSEIRKNVSANDMSHLACDCPEVKNIL